MNHSIKKERNIKISKQGNLENLINELNLKKN